MGGNCLRGRLFSGKGGFGNLVQDVYFGLPANSSDEPDFPEAGVELKTAPLVASQKGLRPKERLVCGIINYMKVSQETDFFKSSFWKKNRLPLLMLYLWGPRKLPLDYLFKHIGLWHWPKSDLAIIKSDWEKITRTIREGRASELSEGSTFYLAACTKGAGHGKNLRSAPGGLAKQRAYSLKPSYVRAILGFPREADSILKRPGEAPDDFERVVIGRFRPFFGLSEDELRNRLSVHYLGRLPKQRFAIYTRAMLKVRSEEISEFLKADVQIKTIRLQQDRKIKEHMSFKTIDFDAILREKWEDSQFYWEISRKFLFVVFREAEGGRFVFESAKFWNMPAEDLAAARRVWEDTKKKIKSGTRSFIAISDGHIAHIRSKDRFGIRRTRELFNRELKVAFWLDRKYIGRQIVS